MARKPVRTTRSRKKAARAVSGRVGGKKVAPRAPARRERRRHEPESLRLRSLEPSLTVNDLERSIRFYTNALGFVVSERWGEGEVLRGVMLKAGVCQLALSQDDWAKGRDRPKGQGMRLMCKTAQDIDALAARIKAAGCALTEEPTDQPWGARTVSVDDPDGFHVTLYRER